MNFEEKLRLGIYALESNIIKLEGDYKEKHKDCLDARKMRAYINRKLAREIKLLVCFNLMPSLEILKNSESFKY